MHRFFVPQECIEDDSVTLDGAVAHQLANVLRARPGDEIAVLDGSGWEHTVTLEQISAREVLGRVTERVPSAGEPEVEITLYQAVLKADRFEFVLQRGTELGVAMFVPVFCERSIPTNRGGEWPGKRLQRWERIVSEAAEQSHRGKVPVLRAPVDFSGACDTAEGLALIPWEEERETGLRATLARWKQDGTGRVVSLFIGPEGGFTAVEIEGARGKGVVPVTLGRRIFRAETAAITAVAAVMYECGELGG